MREPGRRPEAGVPDLLVLEEPVGRGKGILAVELKIGKNKVSAKQQAWLDRAEAHGHTAVVVKTLDALKDAVAAHLHPGSGTSVQPYVVG